MVNVKEERLNITFNPSSLVPKAVAFVNGIEIFSDPQNVYFKGSDNFPLPFVGRQTPFVLNDEYAFEMLYRLNVGRDTDDGFENEFGRWMADYRYIIGSEYGSVLDVHNLRVQCCAINSSSHDYMIILTLFRKKSIR